MPDHVVVNVAEGALRGCQMTLKSGTVIVRFQGIPYATPPVGPLRFKAPRPPLPWTGIREALCEGNQCIQINPITQECDGDEDCLYLNVFTPQVPGKGDVLESRKAVMVFIHGGGFANGAGSTFLYSPDYLVEQDVVVVTLNYRLGPLGFLGTEDGEIPGNAGMKDQVAALRWVQQNIAQLGGDPGNVTIFGESAGGASVHYHVLSPMSRGLFHRAISQSGSALNDWAYSTAARSRTFRLAHHLGCKSDNSKEVLAFLMGVPARQLVENQKFALSAEEKRRCWGECLPFVPTSEGKSTSPEEKFLSSSPIEIIESGNFAVVPYITGVNTNEGLLTLSFVRGRPDVLQKIDTDFERLLPEDLFPQIDTTTSKMAAQKLKKFYFGDGTVCENTLDCYCHLKSDTMFVYMINKTVQLHAQRSTAPLYYYQFAFDGSLGWFKHYFLNTDIAGVCHADELGYLFNPSMFEINCEPDSPEGKVLKMMVTMWTNFAKAGNPSADTRWLPVSPSRLCYLKIDKVPIMMQDMNKRTIDFWDEFYHTYKHADRRVSKL